jgi:hypothetical protein
LVGVAGIHFNEAVVFDRNAYRKKVSSKLAILAPALEEKVLQTPKRVGKQRH